MCHFCHVVTEATNNSKNPMGFTPEEMVSIFEKMAEPDGIHLSPLFQKSDVIEAIKWLFTNGFIAILIGHKYNPNDHAANQYVNGPAYAEAMQQPSPFGILPPGVEEINSDTIRTIFNDLFPGLNLTEEEMIDLGTGDFDESVAKLSKRFEEIRDNGPTGFSTAPFN